MTARPFVERETPAVHALIKVLEESGIDTVFGLSGGHTGRIVLALADHQDTVRTVLVRQESLAGPMAETYGRLTGRPGVLLGQGAFIMGFGLPGILEAKLSGSPMLVVTELSDRPPYSMHAPYQSGTGHYGGWNAEQAFRAVSKEVFVAHEPAEVVIGAQLGIKHALAGTPGPVTLLLSGAALAGTVGPTTQPALYESDPFLVRPRLPADEAFVERAVIALEAARRPVVVAGNGVRVSGAASTVARFVAQLDLPVVTTAGGKGVVSEADDRSLGVFGTYGLSAANACVAEADLLLIVGSRLGINDTAVEHPRLIDPARQAMIQIDIDPRNVAWTFPADHPLVGDAGTVLEQLTLASEQLSGKSGAARVAEYRARFGYFDSSDQGVSDAPVPPQRVIADLARTLPPESVVSCDAGENRLFMTHFYKCRSVDGFLQASGLGPMGYAIPSALAAKLVYPERPVVAVCGDGGFAMSMNGLLTALQYEIDVTVVVLNNQYLGWSLHSRNENSFATYLGDFDYAAIARSMGCNGYRVNTADEVAPAVRSALAASGPTVIDVATSLELSYRDVEAVL